MSLLDKVIRKLKKGAWFPFYNTFYDKLKLDDSMVLLESRGGKSLEGNIMRIIEELDKPLYENFHKVLVVHRKEKIKIASKVRFYDIKNIKFTVIGSIAYYYFLAKAKYLINDTSFPGRFIKKEGQIYLNTWHGTPLKRMGIDNQEEKCSMGNVMRNLLMSDFLIFPNEYMEEKMKKAYLLDNLYEGVVLKEGYPRNAVFFDSIRGLELKEKLGYGKKELIIYMPTFRGQVAAMKDEQQNRQTQEHLQYFNDNLSEDQLMLVKMHPLMVQEIDLSGYSHVKFFPKDYETYEVLNAADILITDYSSVFYDFANTGKKIILFTYDEDEYRKERGIYEKLEDYPFEIAKNCKEVMKSIQKREIKSYEAFCRRYCTYDNQDAAKRICEQVFLEKNSCMTCCYTGNGKENILIYAGDLAKNGITTALCSMLNKIDRSKFNYYISFRKSNLEKEPERLKVLPENFGIIPIASEMNMDIFTMAAQICYMKYGKCFKWIEKRLNQGYYREWKKHFGNIPFRHVIHYNGYESYVIALIQHFKGRKTIWVHNDMQQEIEQKKNQNRFLLRDAYREYDNVVVVSEDIKESTYEISGKSNNIIIINNCHDYKSVIKKAEETVEFEQNTISNISLEELKKILESPYEKFINIGRFSVEKGHKRLISAFDHYWKLNKKAYLIIIGGTGDLYEETLALAQGMNAASNIILIKSVNNPMPILKKCNLFILSSLYEGLGLVLLEADTLGLPVFACDINGPRGFLTKHGGVLVENSEEGILYGMELYKKGQLTNMNIDYEKLNEENIRVLEKIL